MASFDEPPHVVSETNIFFKLTEKNKRKTTKMNVWCHLSTIFSQRRTLQIAGLLTLCVALITTLFLSVVTNAAPGVNQTISFQGRLLSTQGTPVPDGYYNIQFKIYQDGSGTTANNPDGTLKWTETRINNGGSSGVFVKNGYMSVDLGSQTPFGTSVDWNQDTLWLSMNIAGSSSVCTTFGSSPCLADGEMLPMKRLTATPYSLNSAKLEGKSASDFIQNGTTQQTGDFNISGTGSAGILQASTSVLSGLFDRADSGTLSIGSSNATAITVGSTTANQTIAIGTGTGNNAVSIGSTAGSSVTTVNGGTGGVAIASSGEITLGTGASDTLTIDAAGVITTHQDSQLVVNGTAQFNNGIVVQGDSLALLTAINNNGQANIGIGNSASAGYALDVTGAINASDTYSINGVSVLNNAGLNFSAASTSTVSAASGQVLELASDSNVRIGDGTATGEPTLLTVDKSSTTPTATGDDILGSMYYDTTLGKLQCYEADGWGSCSSSPDNFITLSPEYTNAVTNGTGIGDMTSDICSDALNLNDGSSAQPTICGTNETYNFYKWTTAEASAQTKDIYVTYQLPSSFTGFVDGSTSLVGRTDDTASDVSYRVYKNTPTGLVACGSSVSVSTGVQTAWQKVTAAGSADPANCGFTANDSIVVKISLTSEYTTQATNAYASTLSFAFSDN
ncbi:MAG: hypothetical protein ACOH18_00305 [Candidatus Saccharimonadaceae bacterium]